jgi:hypothetical protein
VNALDGVKTAKSSIALTINFLVLPLMHPHELMTYGICHEFQKLQVRIRNWTVSRLTGGFHILEYVGLLCVDKYEYLKAPTEHYFWFSGFIILP